jgi:WD40 repeat protein
MSVVFSADGSLLASGSWDGSIMLWDLSTDRVLGRPLVGHGDKIESVAFSPDGKLLASAGWDSRVFLWNMSLDAWQTRACVIAGRNLSTEEWDLYFTDQPYAETCPTVPAGQ